MDKKFNTAVERLAHEVLEMGYKGPLAEDARFILREIDREDHKSRIMDDLAERFDLPQ